MRLDSSSDNSEISDLGSLNLLILFLDSRSRSEVTRKVFILDFVISSNFEYRFHSTRDLIVFVKNQATKSGSNGLYVRLGRLRKKS